MAVINKQEFTKEFDLHELFADTPKYKQLQFIEDVFAKVAEHVTQGNTVSIAGFGKFEPFKLTSGKVAPKFRPFKEFKDAVNQ